MFEKDQEAPDAKSMDELVLTLKAVADLTSKNEKFDKVTLAQAQEKEVFLVVGNTGVGKSTIINYMLGQYAICKSKLMYCDIAIICPKKKKESEKNDKLFKKKTERWKKEYARKAHQLPGFLFIFSHNEDEWKMLHVSKASDTDVKIVINLKEVTKQQPWYHPLDTISQITKAKKPSSEELRDAIKDIYPSMYELVNEEFKIEETIFANPALAKAGAKSNSCTSEIELYQAKNKHYLADCPGFSDTRKNNRLYNSIALQRFITAVETVRGIIIVIDWAAITNGRYQAFLALANTLNKFLFELEKLPILFLINRCSDQKIENIYSFVDIRLKEVEDNLIAAYQAIKDNKSPDHEPGEYEKYRKLLYTLKLRMRPVNDGKVDDRDIEHDGIVLINLENDESRKAISLWMSKCYSSVKKSIFNFANDPDRYFWGQLIDKKVPHWLEQIKKCTETKGRCERNKQLLTKQQQLVNSQKVVDELQRTYYDECDFYLMESFPTDMLKYANSYILVNQEIRNTKTGGSYTTIRINATEFLQELAKVLGCSSPIQKNEKIVVPLSVLHRLTKAMDEQNSMGSDNSELRCELHLMAILPEKTTAYSCSYILADNTLYYVTSRNENQKVTITDFPRFLQCLEDINVGKVKEGAIYLSKEELYKLITLNGGHNPGHALIFVADLEKTIETWKNQIKELEEKNVKLEGEINKYTTSEEDIVLCEAPIKRKNTESWWNGSFGNVYVPLKYRNPVPCNFHTKCTGSVNPENLNSKYKDKNRYIGFYCIPYKETVDGSVQFVVKEKDYLHTKAMVQKNEEELAENKYKIQELKIFITSIHSSKRDIIARSQIIDKLHEVESELRANQISHEEHKQKVSQWLAQLRNDDLSALTVEEERLRRLIEEDEEGYQVLKNVILDIIKPSVIAIKEIAITLGSAEQITGSCLSALLIEEYDKFCSVFSVAEKAVESGSQEALAEEIPDFDERSFLREIIHPATFRKQRAVFEEACKAKIKQMALTNTVDYSRFQSYFSLIKGVGAAEIQEGITHIQVAIRMFEHIQDSYLYGNYADLLAKLICNLIFLKKKIDVTEPIFELITALFEQFPYSKKIFGFSLLWASAKSRQLKLLQKIVDKGVPINILDNQNYHLLDHLLQPLLVTNATNFSFEVSKLIEQLTNMGLAINLDITTPAYASPALHALVQCAQVIPGNSLFTEHENVDKHCLLSIFLSKVVNSYKKQKLLLTTYQGKSLLRFIIEISNRRQDREKSSYRKAILSCFIESKAVLHPLLLSEAIAIGNAELVKYFLHEYSCSEVLQSHLYYGLPSLALAMSVGRKNISALLLDRKMTFNGEVSFTLSKVVRTFLGNSKARSCLRFDVWYDASFFDNLLPALPNQPNCLYYHFNDSEEDENTATFNLQLKTIIQLSDKLNKTVLFVAKEPGARNHFVLGLYFENKLVMVNPLGSSTEKPFYEALDTFLQDNVNVSIWFSETSLQRKGYEDSLYSCGVIILELARYILEEVDEASFIAFFDHLPKQMAANNALGQVRKIGNCYMAKINRILPKSLQDLLLASRKEEYQRKIIAIRESHLNLLCYYTVYIPSLYKTTDQMAFDAFIEEYNANRMDTPMREIMNLLMVESRSIADIHELPQYEKLQAYLTRSCPMVHVLAPTILYNPYPAKLVKFLMENDIHSGLPISILQFALRVGITQRDDLGLLLKTLKVEKGGNAFLPSLYDAAKTPWVFKELWARISSFSWGTLKQKFLYDRTLLQHVIKESNPEVIEFICSKLSEGGKYQEPSVVPLGAAFWYQGKNNAIAVSANLDVSMRIRVELHALKAFVNFFLTCLGKKENSNRIIGQELLANVKTIIFNDEKVRRSILHTENNIILCADQIATNLIRLLQAQKKANSSESLPSLFFQAIHPFLTTQKHETESICNAIEQLKKQHEFLTNKLIQVCQLILSDKEAAQNAAAFSLDFFFMSSIHVDTEPFYNDSGECAKIIEQNKSLREILIQILTLTRDNFEKAKSMVVDSLSVVSDVEVPIMNSNYNPF